jgi:hypothetical protein
MADETIGTEAADATGQDATPLSLIYLDVDDEITSAAARIRAAGAERVALVLPYGSRLATSRINFRLLAREAAERGKRIEIICADPSARALALAAGLPVHASVAAFEGRAPVGMGEGGSSTADPRKPSRATDQESAGRAATGAGATVAGAIGAAMPEAEVGDETPTRVLALPRRSSPRVPIVGPARPPVRTAIAIGIGLALVALVLVGGILALELLPSATIVLNPRSEALGPLPLTVEARADVTAPDPQSLVIPAQRFTFALQASQTFPATGTKVIETKATGNVTFSNFDTGRGVVIPVGTVVKTDSNVEFETLSAITLPRATFDFFPPFRVHPSQGNVAVEALVAGQAGNVGNNAITQIPKARNTLTVTNPEATAGGARTESPQVSEADVSRARDALDLAIATELDRQVAEATGVPAGITLFPQTKIAGDSQFAVDPQTIVGVEAADFDLAATAQGTALGVDPSPIAAVADARLRTRVTPGWSLLAASITSEVGSPSVLGEVISYPVTIRGTQVHDVDAKALVPEIEGLVLAEARSRLAAFGDVQITLWPDWVTTVPTRADRITFTLAEPKPVSTPPPSPGSSPASSPARSPAPSP